MFAAPKRAFCSDNINVRSRNSPAVAKTANVIPKDMPLCQIDPDCGYETESPSVLRTRKSWTYQLEVACAV